MNWNKAEELLERFYAGTSSMEEEKELKELLVRTDVPRHLQQDAALLRQLQQAEKEETSLSDEELFSRLDGELTEKRKPAGKSIQLPLKSVWQLAAAVALLAIGYWLGAVQPTAPAARQETENTVQSRQLAQIQREVEEMKSLLTQDSPSQRIKAVNNVQETGDADEELIQVLIQTMHFDENINVRMAAIQALLHFKDRPLVRNALIQTLHIQNDPNVQLQLIDGLVEMGEKKAVPEMQDLLKNKELQEVVKIRLQQGIGFLI